MARTDIGWGRVGVEIVLDKKKRPPAAGRPGGREGGHPSPEGLSLKACAASHAPLALLLCVQPMFIDALAPQWQRPLTLAAFAAMACVCAALYGCVLMCPRYDAVFKVARNSCALWVVGYLALTGLALQGGGFGAMLAASLMFALACGLLMATSFVALMQTRATPVSLVLAVIASYLLQAVSALVPSGMGEHGLAAAYLAVSLIVLVRPSDRYLERARTPVPVRELLVTTPRAVLPGRSTVFTAVLMINFSTGLFIAVMLGTPALFNPMGEVLSIALGMAAMVAVLVWAAARGGSFKVETLMGLSFCLLISGVALLLGPWGSMASVMLLVIEAPMNLCTVFMLLYIVTPRGAVDSCATVLMAVRIAAMQYVGQLLGALYGSGTVALGETSLETGATVAYLLVIFASAVFGLFRIGGLDLTAESENLDHLEPTATPGRLEDGASDAGLRAIAERACLTPRETDVFRLLARGYNAGSIREKLDISYNTAKVHVGRIYAKLGVHSQQELIELVEKGMQGGGETPRG